MKKTVIRAIELGASGYLHKDLENHDITSAIQQVIEGGAPLSPSIASHLLRRLRGSASPASDTASDRPAKCCSESRHSHSMTRCNQGLGSSERLQANEELQYKDEPNGRENKEMLTIREIQILQLIAHGHLLSEVAKELNISVHTVSSHNRNIYRKLQAHSRSEAVYKALKTGIIASNI